MNKDRYIAQYVSRRVICNFECYEDVGKNEVRRNENLVYDPLFILVLIEFIFKLNGSIRLIAKGKIKEDLPLLVNIKSCSFKERLDKS